MSEYTATILVIDNDESLTHAIAARLESTGYACLTARTGAQGLSVFRESSVDLVITDLNMPLGNGVALMRQIRAISPVPIIVVTGFHDAYRKELRGIKDVSLLKKPFDSNQLVDLVDAELALSRTQTH